MKFRILSFLFFVHILCYGVRNPFSMQLNAENNKICLNGILEVSNKNLALLNFFDESAVVELGAIAFEKWKVVKFTEHSVELENILTNQIEILNLVD